MRTEGKYTTLAYFIILKLSEKQLKPQVQGTDNAVTRLTHHNPSE